MCVCCLCVTQDDQLGELVSPELLRAYISLARRQSPYVPPELSDYVVAHYCALRQKERDEMDGRSYVTPRTLLSILRLAQAVAKLRFDEEVSSVVARDVPRMLRVLQQ